MVDELEVTLTGTALNWLHSISDPKTPLAWSVVREKFLKKFGGGVDPTLIALKELKKLHQGNRSMRVFGPIITDLLSRAQIFAPGVQLDYFKDRIRNELRTAIIYRGPTDLEQAIQITTDVEEDLRRVLGSKPMAVSSVSPVATEYATMSSGSTQESQNYQYGNSEGSTNGSGGYRGGSGGNSGGARGGSGHETRRCFTCNNVGHLSVNCFKNKKPKQNQEHQYQQQDVSCQQSTDVENMIDIFAHLGKLPQNNQGVSESEELEARRFTTIVKIDGGEQKCLVDAGSTLTSIRESTASRLNL
ncbi:uncharacterized protein EV154DRAFT_390283, partial [Mucor mucedo]|uniref:uncharacterized protein n=1 Tax=Mucor mucedo TaxID=29922 RepID=UPI002220C472